MDKMVVISGISGGGKSTILDALDKQGFSVVSESGRWIIKQSIANNSDALPWINPVKFAEALIKKNLDNYLNAQGLTFFDRSILDAISYYRVLTGNDIAYADLLHQCQYYKFIFFTPPWPEIYQNDSERKHDYNAAYEEFIRLEKFYPANGYNLVNIPPDTVEKRVEFIINKII